MDSNELLIEPFVYDGPGVCPDCGHLLTIADTELTIMDVNNEGTPISETTITKANAYCRNCRRKQPMMFWKGKYIPFSEASYIMLTSEAKDEVAERYKLMEEQAKGVNPLAIGK